MLYQLCGIEMSVMTTAVLSCKWMESVRSNLKSVLDLLWELAKRLSTHIFLTWALKYTYIEL